MSAAVETQAYADYYPYTRPSYGFLPYLAWAAFRAMSVRCSGVSLAARALPPRSPPKRPNWTAAGFFLLSPGDG